MKFSFVILLQISVVVSSLVILIEATPISYEQQFFGRRFMRPRLMQRQQQKSQKAKQTKVPQMVKLGGITQSGLILRTAAASVQVSAGTMAFLMPSLAPYLALGFGVTNLMSAIFLTGDTKQLEYHINKAIARGQIPYREIIKFKQIQLDAAISTQLLKSLSANETMDDGYNKTEKMDKVAEILVDAMRDAFDQEKVEKHKSGQKNDTLQITLTDEQVRALVDLDHSKTNTLDDQLEDQLERFELSDQDVRQLAINSFESDKIKNN